MGIRDWYHRDIGQNNDAPRLRFTNTRWYYEKPLAAFADATLDRLEKAGPTQHQWERSHMFAEKVAAERTRNSMRWKHRLTEWITWKVPLFRRFYNTEVNEATGALHRSIVDPRNGRKYLLTSRGRFTGRARRGWSSRATILDLHTGQPVDPQLQTFLQNNGVFLGRNLWDYHNQVGRIFSEMRDVGTDNERECMRFIILPHDNNSGPMEALEDGTELYVRAYNSKGQWVALTPELQDRLFTHGYAKYPHYPAAIMQFLADAWARASSDLVTQRQLLEMQREAEFGRFATETAGRALQREDRNVHVYGLGGQGGPGAVPLGAAPVGPGGPHPPPPPPPHYPGGGGGPGGGPYPGGPMPAGTSAYYGQAVGGDGAQQWVPQHAGPAHYGNSQRHSSASPNGYGPAFNPANDYYASQMAAQMQQNQERAEALVDSYYSMMGGMHPPGFTPGTDGGHSHPAPTSDGQRADASLDDRVWWSDAGRSGQVAGSRSSAPAGTAFSR